MPEMLDHVAYLSREIGPRPAGTEEEQQAALYITEQMQKEARLSAVIEDFKGAPDADLTRVVCCACAFVMALLAVFVPVMGVAAIVVTIAAAVFFTLEALDRPVLSNMLARGVSQNVVAKYEPGYSAEMGGSRRRKIILMARYDSGKVRPEARGALLDLLPMLQWAELGAMVALPVLLVLRVVVFPNAEGVADIALRALIILAAVLALVPLILAVIHRVSAYNEGANCNAAGVAVLMEVARRVGRGRVSEAELARRSEARVRSEQEAYAAGVVPEGAELYYEAPASYGDMEEEDEEELLRLASAKAAVAALTGRPVDGAMDDEEIELAKRRARQAKIAKQEARQQALQAALAAEEMFGGTADDDEAKTDVEAAGEGVSEQYAEFEEVDEESAAVVEAEPAPVEEVDDGVPAWFKAAQAKAKKPEPTGQPAQRSRYADALDAAMAQSAAHFAEANDIVEHRLEQTLDTGRDSISEVKAPQWNVMAGGKKPSQPAVVPDDVDDRTTAMPPMKLDLDNPEGGKPEGGNAVGADAAAANAAGTNPVASNVAGIDPKRDQQAAFDALAAEPRTPNRVDVTGSIVGLSGRIAVVEDDPTKTVTIGPAPEKSRSRRPIVLPDIGTAAATIAPITELPKQRAPLADAQAEGGKSAAKSLLSMLPTITLGAEEDAAPTATPDADAQATSVLPRVSLPSLSGPLVQSSSSDNRPSLVNTAGAFVPTDATSAFAPVGDELVENVALEDLYVDDADDSAYEENIMESGAFAGPGYVEMPKSRVQRLFGRFHKSKTVETSAQEWLDVDEDFDARRVGAERGGWESFRSDGYENDSSYSAYDEFDDDDHWNGGAYSSRRMERADLDSEIIAEEAAVAAAPPVEVSEELQQIYQFRNPDINTEVWFVALGSELAQNGGMRAFLDEHQQDLRGSIIVDLDALGAGDLCVVDQEGTFRSAKTSSRMKRYVRKTSQVTGISVGGARITWKDSAASYAIKRGYQAMHLVGMLDGKPAFFAQADDVLENIDEELLLTNADFVMELIKNI